MHETHPGTTLSRRRFSQLAAGVGGSLALRRALAQAPEISLEIAPYVLEASPKHHIKTVAYNGQVPGPLIRMREVEPRLVEIRNRSADPDLVHWHGLFLTSEIRPIIDKSLGRWYFAFNPALERTWHGPDVSQGIGFSPAVKVSYDFTRVVSAGLEYYADYGRIGAFDTLHQQQQQIFVVTDLNTNPKWEINIGVGVGSTAATDHLIAKGILGRRFDWGRHSEVE